MARVIVDVGQSLGHVDRKIFGGFIEHLGRCVYGGIYDEGSPLADADGFRTDVLALLRGLRVSVLRWPGGNFASNYHWMDGIGPKENRPRRLELAWGGEESNRFGTDEFLAYCAALGAEPYICLNMGTGTLQEALQWVEYCNGAGRTSWVERRRANGHAEPYRVRYWGLGNEMYGEWQIGALSAEEYVSKARRWAAAIKKVDPDVVLVSCGLNGWSEWDRIVIDALAPLVDLHSIHLYTGASDYWTNVLQPHQAERAIRHCAALIDRAVYLQGLPRRPLIAYDEWNVWYRAMDGVLEERYDWADGLAVATYLNIFLRSARWIGMANVAQLVNAIGLVATTPERAATQPIYHPFLLHARAALDEAIGVRVDCDPIRMTPDDAAPPWRLRISDLGPFAVLDAAATTTTDRTKLALTIVNRDAEREIPTDIVLRDAAFAGTASVRILTGETDSAQRVIPDVQTVSFAEFEEKAADSRLTLKLPPASFTVVEAALTPE
ncbi:MAG: hypothetical protein K6T28_09190 [Acidothermus sp.]|nr:hypothetical protein [Acidothermus sp.]